MTDIPNRIDRIYRHHYGEILAFLLNRIGFQNFEIAEEAVQAAFERALRQWPAAAPENPRGWLSIVARNAAVDILRQQRRREQRENDAARDAQQAAPEPDRAYGGLSSPAGDSRVDAQRDASAQDLDDVAKMLLLCCNPGISPTAQVCLALKAVCGFRVREISRVLGLSLAAAKKTLTRARDAVARDPDAIGELSPPRIETRFGAVQETIYAIFTEAHAASAGENRLRQDLAREALRLADLLLASNWTPAGRKPGLHALIALIFFQMARFPARLDANGAPLRLKEQDRGKWDRGHIRAGFAALAASQATGPITVYHLEARIAAEHARSRSFTGTDWPQILRLYDQLLTLKDTRHVRLNRIVALRYAIGPGEALRALDALGEDPARTDAPHSGAPDASRMAWSFLYHAVRADLHEASGQVDEARKDWESARADAPTGEDRRFVEGRLQQGQTGSSPAGRE